MRLLSYEPSYYHPTDHLYRRYRQRMSKHVESKELRKQICYKATRQELARRANYMLLFSIFGEEGYKPNTEVRYYFDWNIVVDNAKKQIITMYRDERRPMPPAHLFGDRKLRGLIYDIMFRPKSRIGKAIYA